MMKQWVESYWLLVVAILATSSISSDVLAKRHNFWAAVVIGWCASPLWGVLLGSRAPFARSIAAFSVLNYVVAAMLGVAMFGEHLTEANAVGLGLGLVAIGLLL